ncbi:MAG: hypothetical protein GY711_08710 [bacterium]|nr:hypothetical protein [bacterium]
MSNSIQLALIALAATCTLACQSGGGTHSGISPMPEDIRGTIEGDAYTSEDGSFSVDVPHPRGTYEHEYMQIAEVARAGGWSVQFGPAGLDETLYRVDYVPMVEGAPGVEIGAVAEPLFARSLRPIEAESGGEAVRAAYEETTVGGHAAIFAAYEHQVPSKRRAFGTDVAGETRFHSMYLVDYGDATATFWVTVPVAKPEQVPAVRNAVVGRRHRDTERFVESMRRNAAASPAQDELGDR